jgi:hypothetical protein
VHVGEGGQDTTIPYHNEGRGGRDCTGGRAETEQAVDEATTDTRADKVEAAPDYQSARATSGHVVPVHGRAGTELTHDGVPCVQAGGGGGIKH